MPLCGGFSEVQPADKEITDMVIKLRPEVEDKAGKTFSEFNPISYKSQVVAGMNYTVKVQVADKEFITVSIYQPLPHTGDPAKVTSFEEGEQF